MSKKHAQLFLKQLKNNRRVRGGFEISKPAPPLFPSAWPVQAVTGEKRTTHF